MKKPELLAPAGNLEKCKMALRYGADAVYLGGKQFGLRAFAANFSAEELREAVAFAHALGRRVYVTVNIVAHNRDLPGVREYLGALREIRPDALIISDPGIFALAGEIAPEIERHISTQTSCSNAASFNFWYGLGARRVVAARELSVAELAEIRRAGIWNVIQNAMNQAFFTLSIGMGGMAIFGSYIGKDHALLGESVNVAALDTFVAFTSGLIIFPACFAYGVRPDSGPALIFKTLPNIFNHMAMGRLWGALFFVFMTFAAFSTVIGVFENIIAMFMDLTGFSKEGRLGLGELHEGGEYREGTEGQGLDALLPDMDSAGAVRNCICDGTGVNGGWSWTKKNSTLTRMGFGSTRSWRFRVVGRSKR